MSHVGESSGFGKLYLDHHNASDVFRARIKDAGLLPAIGVYDVFSASLAARKFETIFLSGYGFCASTYGLPDEGFIAWPDMVAYCERVRAVIPGHHIIVDIDDGYGDPLIAANVCLLLLHFAPNSSTSTFLLLSSPLTSHLSSLSYPLSFPITIPLSLLPLLTLVFQVVQRLERVGASAIIMEDQVRPKKCGHLPGKEILPIDTYLVRLRRILRVRKHLFIVARTDSEGEDALARIKRYAEEGADAVMIDGLRDLSILKKVRETIPPTTHLVVNLIAGGKTAPVSLSTLKEAGVNITLFSTPCLFAAHAAVERVLDEIANNDGILSVHMRENSKQLAENNITLKQNLNALMTWTDAGTCCPSSGYTSDDEKESSKTA
jgi:2-methylisocitrate lyase-like PEP mutase family enzyme